MARLIDHKGRIFGLINIFDFLALCFALSLTPMFYYGWNLNTAPKTPASQLPKYVIQEEYDKLKIKVSDYELLLNTLIKERDTLQSKINNYLKEHKRAGKYFR